jgi:hypothetical protein
MRTCNVLAKVAIRGLDNEDAVEAWTQTEQAGGIVAGPLQYAANFIYLCSPVHICAPAYTYTLLHMSVYRRR